jgi:hypothetical protein
MTAHAVFRQHQSSPGRQEGKAKNKYEGGSMQDEVPAKTSQKTTAIGCD